MIEYELTATFTYGTNIKPEAGLEKEVKSTIRAMIEQEGIDSFLDTLEYGEVIATELSDEEVDALYQDENIRISVEGIKEMLTAVSLGLLELEDITKEQAIQALEKLSKEGPWNE